MKLENFQRVKELVQKLNDLDENLNYIKEAGTTVRITNDNGYSFLAVHQDTDDIFLKKLSMKFRDSIIEIMEERRTDLNAELLNL